MITAALQAVDYAAERDRRLWPVPRHAAGAAAADAADEERNTADNTPSTTHPNPITVEAAEADAGHDVKKRRVEHPGPVREGSHTDAAPGPKPYLCTGWDAFVVREPCAMCAMALTHARVGRVIFCQLEARGGALHGPDRLHGRRSLNHHYTVFHLAAADAADASVME